MNVTKGYIYGKQAKTQGILSQPVFLSPCFVWHIKKTQILRERAVRTNNSFLVLREWAVSVHILSSHHFMKCGSLCPCVWDVLNGQTVVEMQDWLLCLAWSGSGQPRCSWYKQEAGFSTSLVTRKCVFPLSGQQPQPKPSAILKEAMKQHLRPYAGGGDQYSS